jgi:hypothetical protein
MIQDSVAVDIALNNRWSQGAISQKNALQYGFYDIQVKIQLGFKS